MEGGRRFESMFPRAMAAEKARIEANDNRIRQAVSDPKQSAELFERHPVDWIKGAIGLDTNRGASHISDNELAERYTSGGRYEWDPLIAKKVAAYLKVQGITLIP